MKTKEKALKALDGMESIVRNEMLIRGVYLTEEVENPKLKAEGAICGGHKACAIGSLWLGYGVKIQKDRVQWDGSTIASLPGVEEEKRDEFLHRRPGLRMALNALNDEAEAFMKRNKISYSALSMAVHRDLIEQLFEGVRGRNYTVNRRGLLSIIAGARRRIESA